MTNEKEETMNKDLKEQQRLEAQIKKMAKRKRDLDNKILINLAKKVIELNKDIKTADDFEIWFDKADKAIKYVEDKRFEREQANNQNMNTSNVNNTNSPFANNNNPQNR